MIYFAPSLVGSAPLPSVTLVVALLNTLIGCAFTYFYIKVNGARPPEVGA